MNSPAYEPILPTKELDALIPVYPMFSGMNQKLFAKLQKEIISSLPEFLVDYLPDKVREENKLCTLTYAYENIHFPKTEEALDRATDKETARSFTVFYSDTDFTGITGRNFFSVRIKKMNVIKRNGFAHGTDFMAAAGKVADDKGGFALSETFHDLKSGRVFKLAENFRVKRFAGD